MLRGIILAILFLIATVGLVGCSSDSNNNSGSGKVTVGGGGS